MAAIKRGARQVIPLYTGFAGQTFPGMSVETFIATFPSMKKNRSIQRCPVAGSPKKTYLGSCMVEVVK